MNRLWLLEIPAVVVLVALLVVARPDSAAAEPEARVRVATLLPFVADAVALAPEQATVVASVRRSMHVPLPPDLIDLGNPHSPNFERLAEARPDLIVADARVHAAFAETLAGFGAEVRMIDTAGIEPTLDALSSIEVEIGGSEALRDRIAAVRSEIGALELGDDRVVRVLPLFGAPGTFFAVTDRAWLGQLVEDLGFENLAPSDGDERFAGLVAISDEVLATLEPDLVVLVAHGDPRKIRADLASRTAEGGAWASLGHAKLGVHVLDPRLFSANPGLDLDRAARELVALADGPSAGAGVRPPAVPAGGESAH